MRLASLSSLRAEVTRVCGTPAAFEISLALMPLPPLTTRSTVLRSSPRPALLRPPRLPPFAALGLGPGFALAAAGAAVGAFFAALAGRPGFFAAFLAAFLAGFALAAALVAAAAGAGAAAF